MRQHRRLFINTNQTPNIRLQSGWRADVYPNTPYYSFPRKALFLEENALARFLVSCKQAFACDQTFIFTGGKCLRRQETKSEIIANQ